MLEHMSTDSATETNKFHLKKGEKYLQIYFEIGWLVLPTQWCSGTGLKGPSLPFLQLGGGGETESFTLFIKTDVIFVNVMFTSLIGCDIIAHFKHIYSSI